MYCRACNSIVPEKRFCPFCGENLPRPARVGPDAQKTQASEASPGSIPCPSCRESLLADYGFCPGCGERTSADSRPSQAQAPARPTPDRRLVSEADRARIEEILRDATRLKVAKAYHDALISARRALAIDPDSADAHAMIGEIHHAAGSLEDAITEYTYAADLAPERPGFRDRLRTLELEHKRRDEELASVVYEHEGDLATIFRIFFTRDHHKWYKRGWFNAVLFVGFFVLTIYLVAFCRLAMWIGPLWLRTVMLSMMIVTSFWIFYDAQANDRPGIVWVLVNVLSWGAGFSFLGIIVYLIIRL